MYPPKRASRLSGHASCVATHTPPAMARGRAGGACGSGKSCNAATHRRASAADARSRHWCPTCPFSCRNRPAAIVLLLVRSRCRSCTTCPPHSRRTCCSHCPSRSRITDHHPSRSSRRCNQPCRWAWRHHLTRPCRRCGTTTTTSRRCRHRWRHSHRHRAALLTPAPRYRTQPPLLLRLRLPPTYHHCALWPMLTWHAGTTTAVLTTSTCRSATTMRATTARSDCNAKE